MASITISGLSKESLERLEKRAAIHGRSVEDEVVHILKREIGPDPEDQEARLKEFLEKVEPLLQKQRERLSLGNVDDKPGWLIIREDRDSDHGRLYDPWGLDDSRN